LSVKAENFFFANIKPKLDFGRFRENIDTTISGVKLVFHLFGVLAEFERNLIRERTQAGLQAARVRDRKGGRQQKLTAQEIEIGRSLRVCCQRSPNLNP
jgi:DNA invertase Pin-like site-specific DNA recombinase